MRRAFVFLLCFLAAAAVGAEEVARTWTDTQGRTLSGVFVEASLQEVTVRRSDGSIAHLPRASLSADDLAYADKAQAAKPISATIEASRSKFTTKTTESGIQTTFADGWGFTVNLTNTTLLAAQNLRADYRLYYRRTTSIGDTMSAQPLAHQSGTAMIEELKPKGTASFRTDTVTITTQQLQNATWAATGSGTYTDTKLEGIWVRLYENNALVGEYVSSPEYQKAGWPADAPKRRPRGGAPPAN